MSFPNLLPKGTLAAVAALALAGCAGPSRPVAVAASDFPRSEPGTVVQVRPIVSALSAAASDAVPTPVTVMVVGAPMRSGEAQQGLSYTVLRDSDHVQVEVAQPSSPVLAVGSRVRIVYAAHVRLIPG